jgi:predicted 3-demethylubiquinone-9 3-methyltransferase (glyoxalase superfamily)
MQTISINLWFDDQAEAAASFYTAIFPNSHVGKISHYPDAGQEITGREAGSVLTVTFDLDGQQFIGLNGGPADFSFNESVSLVVNCDTQDQIDHYWEALLADGGEEVQCGWLKDKYGLSWQVSPPLLDELLNDPDPAVASRVMTAMLKMIKIDIAELERTAAGN